MRQNECLSDTHLPPGSYRIKVLVFNCKRCFVYTEIDHSLKGLIYRILRDFGKYPYGTVEGIRITTHKKT